MTHALYPSLYQVNTRVWLGELSKQTGRPATFDDIPDADLDAMVAAGFDLVYFLGVWQTGAAGRAVSRANPEWREEFVGVLPDLAEDDICGSCFAVTGYGVAAALGGDDALARLRARLHRRGLRLILDFVPNHTALDHPWVDEHPEYYVHGTDDDLARAPQNYRRVGEAPPAGPAHAEWGPSQPAPPARGVGGVAARSGGGAGADRGPVLAYGRDPYFAGWPDTLQLDYGNPDLQAIMRAELGWVAHRCDGVRCDMAMLVLPEVFARTWGIAAQPFWPDAIAGVKSGRADFLFMAEVYWDLEWQLQQQGFDYTYDKRLYDRLRSGDARTVRDHLRADAGFQRRSARFLENHDEPRAAATFSLDVHRAAAVVTFFCPGLRFFYQGQLEGAAARLPVHLCRRRSEPVDEDLQGFYRRLLACLRSPAVRGGEWRLLECRPAWAGNWTHDCFIVSAWDDGATGDDGAGHGDDGAIGDDGTAHRVLAVVNYADVRSQCSVPLPFGDLAGARWRLRDLLGDAVYDRDGDALLSPGLYLDLPAWGYHLFTLAPRGA